MYAITFRSRALRDLSKLSPEIQKRIIQKLEFYRDTENPLLYAERLTHFSLGHYRFRMGDWRVVVDVIEDTIVVLAVGHRREIYK